MTFRKLLARKFLAIGFVILIAYSLSIVIAEMPPFGATDTPMYTHVVPRYMEKNVEETGATNIVSSIIVDYRAYDTLGETTVLYTAALGIISILVLEGEHEEGG